MDNPVTDTSDILNTDAVLANQVANTDKPVKGATKKKPQGPHVNALFVFDTTDPEFAPFADLLQKAYFPGARMAGIDSHQKLAATLSKFGTIGRLILFTHSIPGSLLINGTTLPAQKVSQILAKANVVVKDEIVFEGCSIMERPVEACQMVASICEAGTAAIGFTWFSITQIIDIDFTGVTDEGVIKQTYNNFKTDYWLPPGLPSPKDSANKKVKLGRRWFRDTLDKTVAESVSRDIKSYGDLNKERVSNFKDAKALQDSYSGSPIVPADLVTVSGVVAVAQGTP